MSTSPKQKKLSMDILKLEGNDLSNVVAPRGANTENHYHEFYKSQSDSWTGDPFGVPLIEIKNGSVFNQTQELQIEEEEEE